MSLRTKAISGTTWMLVAQLGRQVTQLVTITILSRLLSPGDFGLMAMVTAVTSLGVVISNFGTASALVQRKELPPAMIDSVFWFNAGLGSLITSSCILLSPLIAYFYREPQVRDLIAVVGLSFMITALGTIPRGLLQRKMAFRHIAGSEILAVFTSSLVGIGSALLGCGVWSLVYQYLTLTTISSLMYWLWSRWRPHFYFHWNDVQAIRSFGLYLTGWQLVTYVARNADYLLIGRYLGSQPLGYYMLAYRIMLYPLLNLSEVINRVSLSALSQVQNDPIRFQRAYLKIITPIAIVVFPLMLGLTVLTKPFVLTMFGAQWLPGATLLMILAPVGMLQSIYTTIGPIFESKARPDIYFRFNIVYTFVVVAGFCIGLRWGTVGVATSYALTVTCFFYPGMNLALRLAGLTFHDLWVHIRGAFLSAITMALVVLAVEVLLVGMLQPMWELLIGVTVGVITYTLMSYLINRQQLIELLRYIPFKRFLPELQMRARHP